MAKKITVYPRFALISEKKESEIEIQVNEKGRELREWLQEAAWIYPKQDKEFLAFLEKWMKDHFGESFRMWQNRFKDEPVPYPQYLCSADLRGIGGDVVHLWRDGQSWWPMAGDYSLDDEEQVELILRKAIREFKGKKD